MAKNRKLGRRRTPQANKAIRNEMQAMESLGYPTPQATAIAFRKYRDGELNISSVIRLNKANNAIRQETNAMIQEGERSYSFARSQGITGNLSTIRRLKAFMSKDKKFRGWQKEIKKK